MRTGDITQVVEHLPTKNEALSSTPVPPKKLKITKIKRQLELKWVNSVKMML
jgi:hypothetical protein